MDRADLIQNGTNQMALLMRPVAAGVALAIALSLAGCTGGKAQTGGLSEPPALPSATEASSSPEVPDPTRNPEELEREAVASASAQALVQAQDAEQVSQWAEALFTDALQTLANDLGIGYFPDGEPGRLPAKNQGQGPLLESFPAIVSPSHPDSTPEGSEYSTRTFEVGPAIVGFSNDSGHQIGTTDWADGVRGLGPLGTLAEYLAPNVDQAETLIIVDGFVESVDQGYYQGGKDRVTVRTLVWVIDVASRSVSHIENIGLDKPGDQVSTNARGTTLKDAAWDYVISLF